MPLALPQRAGEALPALQVEVDRIDANGWHALLRDFSDAPVHQSWAWGEAVHGRHRLSHLVLREHGKAVGAAQVVLGGPTAAGLGVAHVKFGPLWRRKAEPADGDRLETLLRLLRAEYAVRRGLLLRIKPWLPPGDADIRKAFAGAGYRYRERLPHYRTLVLDLCQDLPTLKRALKPKWRYHLRCAERVPHDVVELHGSAAVDAFLALYRRMSRRKGFFDTSEIAALPDIVAALPPEQQPVFLFCRHGGAIVAGVVLSCLGDTGFYWFGATARTALEHRLSYALHWRAVSRMQQAGCRWYDLAGVSQPGVHQFKSGLAGRRGLALSMGDYDACTNPLSAFAVDAASRVRSAYRRARIRGNTLY